MFYSSYVYEHPLDPRCRPKRSTRSLATCLKFSLNSRGLLQHGANRHLDDTSFTSQTPSFTAFEVVFASNQSSFSQLDFPAVWYIVLLQSRCGLYQQVGDVEPMPLVQCLFREIPANTRRSANVGLMLGQRRRRWPNIKPTLAERLVFAGMSWDTAAKT